MTDDIEQLKLDAKRYQYLRNRIHQPNGGLWVAMGRFETGLSHWNGIDLDNQIDREVYTLEQQEKSRNFYSSSMNYGMQGFNQLNQQK